MTDVTREFPMRNAVAGVMTREVVTATASTPFKDLARLMLEQRVGAIPVVDPDGRPVGIVSEADLMAKSERPARTLRWIPMRRRLLRKAEGSTAATVMSSPVLTTSSDSTIAATARLLHQRNVKHLPVVDRHGRLVGIVSRADLLKPFLRADDEVRRDLVETVLPRWLWIDPARVGVSVRRGEVTLTGRVERRSDLEVITHVVGRLDGVVAVDNRLTYENDDVSPRMRPTEARIR